MEKIVNYVRNGKGAGLLFILAASILVTIIMLLVAKSFYGDMRPQAITVAKDFLPITVQGKQIVDPVDTYKRVNLDFGHTGGKSGIFTVVLNTRNDAPRLKKGEQGLFIYKDSIQMVTSREVRSYDLQDGVWNLENFEQLLDTVAGAMFAVVGVVLIGILFVICLFKVAVAAFLGVLGQKIMGKSGTLDMSQLMRLCAILVAGLEVLRWGITLLGGTFTGFQAFIVVVAMELFFVYREKADNE
ncbi:MAG: DUF1189 family protein [Acetobacter sp.]|nr:DUF1189 family protein [Acetobacter sp.]